MAENNGIIHSQRQLQYHCDRIGYKADGKIAFLSGSTINEPTAYVGAAVGDTGVNVPVSDISGYVGVAIKTIIIASRKFWVIIIEINVD